MKIFDILSRIPFLRSYASKFLLVAFLGTHVPLIGIVFLILFGESDKLSPLTVLLMMLVFTIVGAAATLATLHYLLEPVRLVSGSLRYFIQNGKPPELPVHYQDEVGQLIKDTQMTLKTQSRLLQEQKDLMSVIAHDIRSPASTALSINNIIRQKTDKKEVVEASDHLKSLGEKQLQMAEDLLQSLKADEQLGPGQKEEVPLAPLIEESIAMYQNSIDEKELKVDVDVPDDLTIQVHKGQFSQVITNLLSNAVKFSYQGGTNRFKAKRDGHAVHLWIEDAGTGISNVDQKELFKRFSSYQKKGTKGEASTGVGLFICKRILEQHHGDIEAQSEGEDKGTTFHITLLRN